MDWTWHFLTFSEPSSCLFISLSGSSGILLFPLLATQAAFICVSALPGAIV
jgi:hypothetical protein